MKLFKKEDLRDSRIFFDKVPPRFMLYLIIFMIVLLITLSYIANYVKRPYVVRAQGQVAIEGTGYIASKGHGVVREILKESGDIVEEGEVILSISSGNEGIQASVIQNQIEDLQLTLKLLDKYEASLQKRENQLSNEGRELEYYAKVEYYLDIVNNEEREEKVTEEDLQGKVQELETEKNKIEILRAEVEEIENEINSINDSIKNNGIDKKNIEEKRVSKKDEIEALQNQEYEEDALKEESVKTEMMKEAASILEDLERNIIEIEEEMVDLQDRKARKEGEKLEKENEIDIAKSAIEGIEEEIRQTKRQLESPYSQAEQTLFQLLSELGQTRNQSISRLTELESNYVAALDQDAIHYVLANNTGKLHYFTPTSIGMPVQQGQIIGEISNKDERMYIDAYVNAQDRSRIEEGKPVKVAISGINTYRFGTLSGIVKFIEPGTVQNESQEGVSVLYRIKVELEKSELESKNGEVLELLRSMPVEARVVYNEESYLQWILGMLNFRN
ncbi:HlyD family efflux transporter periplasmic adaptor subunit [Proteiniclasticum ruminis]|uniref:HlyD family secretion protein n=1 Tax=Proteiniclasticum ruminis TaxID=398199 RepID=A0A1I5EB90_9CLOT|nr:HlyD family efflux transporter periplasmic adaptor subunit [Proteiniclasticum ruminis]SFO08526.1 HlyD family secretion protein [Proteiniclasticum ruminis]